MHIFDRVRFRAGSDFGCEWRPLTHRQRRRVIELATRRKAERRDLTASALVVLHALLFAFHNAATGRMDPAYATIAKHTGLARSTVQAAIGRLEAAGVIEHSRRLARKVVSWACRLTGQTRREPRAVQISNGYRVTLALLQEIGEPSAVAAPRAPETPARSDTGKRSETKHPMNPGPLAAPIEGSNALMEALARLRRAVQRRAATA